MPSRQTVGAVMIGLLVLSSIALWVAVPWLFRKNAESVASTTELSCRLGSFFIGQPVVRQPEQTSAQFEKIVRRARSFLLALRAADCSQVKGASISTRQIERTLHRLPDTPRGGGTSSGSPPGSPPSGGPTGHPPPPPDSGPPPGTTTTTSTTTTTTTTAPPPPHCLLHRHLPVCLTPPVG